MLHRPDDAGLSPQRSAVRLGVITEGSLTKGLTARLEPGCSIEDVRVGRFVKIRGDKYDFFCLITDVALGAVGPAVLDEPPDPADDFLHEVLAGTATFGSIMVQPMLMLNKQPAHEADLREIGKPLPVRTIPGHFAPVDTADQADFERVFASAGESSWEIGTPRDMEIPILLDLDRVAERSNGVFGKSGSGKSMLARILLCGLIRSKRAVSLLFDMHSEYAWPTEDRGAGKMLKSLPELFGTSHVTVYTLRSNRPRAPGRRSDLEIRIGLNEIEPEDIALLSDLLRLNPTFVPTINILEQHLGPTWLADLLAMDREAIKDLCARTVAHPEAVAALARNLKVIQRLEFVDEHVPSGASSIDHLIRSLESGQNVILAFDHADDLLPYMLVANVMTRRIHERWKTNTQNAHAGLGIKPHQLVITIEEAHRFLSPSVVDYTSFGTIARELRKFNVTLLVVDQRPSGIDPEVLSQIGTRFTCQLNDENDIGAMLAGMSGASHLRSVLASLDSQQEAVLLGHAIPMPVVVRVRTVNDAFYADVAAGHKGPTFPAGRRIRELASLPDD